MIQYCRRIEYQLLIEKHIEEGLDHKNLREIEMKCRS